MTTTSPGRVGTVAVPGGDLAYEILAGSTEPVLAIHGVSSHRRLWSWLHAAAPEVTLVAPDLRGRADSVALPGPYAPQQHADDLAAVLDALGIESANVLGMSMGAFVAFHLAHRHPNRVKSLVLVDGGFPMATPLSLTPENVELAFADRLGRLARRWDSVDDYLDYFCASTAPLLDRHDPLLRHYVEHDLGDGLVRLSGEALVHDVRATIFSETPWQGTELPIRFLHAEWSVGRDTPPAYSTELVDRYAGECTTVVAVDGVDHAASIMSPTGARATADQVRKALG